ncbi:MAG: asparagine synthase (glutamine-hydrolyzing) [Verrucomicrobiales bacterium]|jgi:asparagine synthase (glutamine-hydrolysing)
MCGFFGEFSPTGNLLAEPDFRQLLNLSKHRGPDAQAVHRDQICAMGFNRLAILNLSPESMQPMCSPSGRFVLTFNGEIYNFRELAKAHGLQDIPLCQVSDTAVVAHLLDRVSPFELAKSLDGMFAIAIVDRETQTLSLVRDFAGIKPLFYGTSSDRIVFASQFDQVFKHPSSSGRTTNPRVLRDYLQLGYMPAPETLFQEVRQLEPGAIVTIDADLREKRSLYYRLPDVQSGALIQESSEDALATVSKSLIDACRQSLVSDVELGAFVSGGIDSPLIAAIAKQEMPGLRAYTIGVDDPELNEAEIAREYCKALEIQQTVLALSEKEIVSQKEAHFRAFSDPIGDYSSLPTYAITREAKRHATVMLSGDGGDELFWGYPRFYKFVDQRRLLALPSQLRQLVCCGLRTVGRKTSHGIADGLGNWVLDTQTQMLQSDLDAILPGQRENSSGLRSLYHYQGGYSSEAVAHWLRYNEFYGHLQRVLAKVDRASMGNSLEVRVPFLCKKVIEAAWKLQFDASNREPKQLLKRALKPRLHPAIINQRKMGFSAPIDSWLNSTFKDEVREFAHHPVFADDLIDKRATINLTERFYRGEHDHGWAVWLVYSLQKWASVHLNPMTVAR